MSFVNLSIHKAKKDHVCCACNMKIPKGFEYIRSFSVDNGEVLSDKWHGECREEFDRWLITEHEDEGDPWYTWENGLPPEIKKKYGIEVVIE